MKKSLLLVSALLMCTSGAFAQWQQPVPQKTDLVVGDTLYLYNVEAKGFLLGANEWNTRASVSTSKGYKVIIKEADEPGCYWICDSVETKDAVLAMFVETAENIWVDNLNGKNVDSWQLNKLENGSYTITNLAFAQQPLGVAEFYKGEAGNTRLWLNDPSIKYEAEIDDEIHDLPVFSGKFMDEWYFVTPAEYNAIQPGLQSYAAAMALKSAIDNAEAKCPGINLETEKALYENMSSSAEDMKAAADGIPAKVLDFQAKSASWTDPKDVTTSIKNYDFSDGVNSWQGTALVAGSGAAEHYEKNYDTYQILENIPNGIYKVNVAAMYRNGFAANDWQTKDDPTQRNAKIYAVSGSDSLYR